MSSPSEEFLGRMNDPTAAAWLKGPCGDEMELYLVIQDSRIVDVKFSTEGCEATKACGAMTAALARGKTVTEALCISPGEVAGRIQGLSRDQLHCTILSVSALYRAIADYLLRR